MKKLIFFIIFSIIASSAWSRHFPVGTQNIYIHPVTGVRTELLKNIAPIIEKSIANGHYPGAVILVGHKGKIIYRGVFGNRRIIPDIAPMQADTIFDIASLTKVIATAPAIMQLVEQGKINIDAPVANYWPAFGKHGKEVITVRQLLTHTAGLPAEIPYLYKITDKHDAFNRITQIKWQQNAGKTFLYSDVNFIVLAHLVEIITHESFDHYVQKNIFTPLGMQHTFFVPDKKWRDQIAPTEVIEHELRWGVAHDPHAYLSGGVMGNAGVFSDAHDIGIYAQALLNGGKLPQPYAQQTHFLSPLSVAKMTSAQTPDSVIDTRGFGWDIDSRYSNRGHLFPVQSFGHTGYTGASLWIDPVTQTWIVFLVSRTHPVPEKHNQLISDRQMIANIISASIVDINNHLLLNTSRGELERAFARFI